MKNFFKGISVSQIIAGALAAVTSFLLSAKIGIAGSVIGVAVGSIVSAVASQIYQNVLNESGKKFQEGTPGDEPEDEIARGSEADDRTRVIGSDAQHHGQLNADVVSPLAHGTSTLRLDGTSSSLAALAKTGKKEPENSKKDATKALVSAKGDVKNGGNGDSGATQAMKLPASGKTTVMSPVNNGEPGKAVASPTKLKGPGQHDGHIHTFESSRQKRYKRVAVIVAVVSALVAVGVTAGIISVVTKGQGTDDVVRNIVTNSSTKTPKQQSDDSGRTSTQDSQNTDSSNQQNGSTGKSNSGSTGNSDTSSGSGSSTTGNGTGTASGSSSGSSSGTGSGSDTSSSGNSSTTGSNGNSESGHSGSSSTDTSHSGSSSTDSGSAGESTGTGTGTGSGSNGSTTNGSTSGSQSGTSKGGTGSSHSTGK